MKQLLSLLVRFYFSKRKKKSHFKNIEFIFSIVCQLWDGYKISIDLTIADHSRKKNSFKFWLFRQKHYTHLIVEKHPKKTAYISKCCYLFTSLCFFLPFFCSFVCCLIFSVVVELLFLIIFNWFTQFVFNFCSLICVKWLIIEYHIHAEWKIYTNNIINYYYIYSYPAVAVHI